MTTTTIDARGDAINFSMTQGNSFQMTLTLRDILGTVVNLTGVDVRAQFRRSYSASSADINCTLANSKVVLVDAILGKIKLVLLPADTTSLKFSISSPEELELVYDIEVVRANGEIFKPARGTCTISREVTR